MSATNKALNIDPARNDESNVPRILGLGVTFHGLALIFFGLRMYTRAFVVKSFGKDDILMVLCMVGLTGGGMVTIAIATAHGLGRHAWILSPEDVIIYGKTVFVQALLTTVTSLCLLKLSVAFSLLRLSGPMNVWWNRVIWGLIIFVCLYMLESWISILAYCDPIAAHWDKKLLKTAKCWPKGVWSVFPLFNTACNMFTDVCFATLPIPIIWRLKMKQRTRVYLVGVFSLGYIAVFIGVAKCVSQIRFRGDPDAVFHNWTQTLGFLQQNVGVVAACAPSLRPLVGKWLRIGESSAKDSHYYAGGYKRSNHSNQRTKEEDAETGYEMDSPTSETPKEKNGSRGFGGVGSNKFNSRTTVRGGMSPNSSEERIIGGDTGDNGMPEGKGVVRTVVTEVRVS